VHCDLETAGGAARFVVTGTDPHPRDVLAALGYLPVDERRSATRWFPWSAGVDRYQRRFAASIEQMVQQKARRVAVPWESALLELLRRVEGTRLRWWLYGSAALAVRGLPVEPADVDVRVDDAALAAALCDDLLVTPVERLDGWVARHAGRAFCHAVVEFLADPHPELDDPAAPSEQGVFVEPDLETVAWRGHLIRVPPLAAQLRSCEQRGLTERAELVRRALRTAGSRRRTPRTRSRR
jgi:hypothetical protein